MQLRNSASQRFVDFAMLLTPLHSECAFAKSKLCYLTLCNLTMDNEQMKRVEVKLLAFDSVLYHLYKSSMLSGVYAFVVKVCPRKTIARNTLCVRNNLCHKQSSFTLMITRKPTNITALIAAVLRNVIWSSKKQVQTMLHKCCSALSVIPCSRSC